MRRVLLIADLEGIAGVDRIEQLVFGGPGYAQAALRMNEEVSMVALLLLEHGVQHVRVSDTHHSGAANLEARFFPAGCELVTDVLADDVDAVACVGMHALGDSHGFGAHTVNVNTDWSLGTERLTESRIVELLAAERGVPFWFTSGCDVLEQQVTTPFVRTKTSVSRALAKSSSLTEVDRAFRHCISTTTPRSRGRPARVPLQIRFQKRAEAKCALGGTLASPTVREVPVMNSFREQFDAAWQMIESTSEQIAARTHGDPSRLLLDAWD